MTHTLTLTVPGGSPITLDVRGAAEDVAEVPVDVAAQWDAADGAGATAGVARSQALIAQCRFALLSASVRSIVGAFPPALLSALVRTGRWSVARALGVGRAAPTPLGRARALAHLLPTCPTADQPALAAEFLDAVATFARDERPEDVCQELVALAQACPVAHRTAVLRHGLLAVRSLVHDYAGVSAIETLAPLLSPPLLRAALRLVHRFTDPFHQQLVVSALAPHLPGPVHGLAIQVATTIPDPTQGAIALLALVPGLALTRQDQVIDRITTAVAGDAEPGACVRPLLRCAGAAAEPVRTRLLHLALRLLPHIAQDGGPPLPAIADVSAFAEALEPEQRGSADGLFTAFETLAAQQVIQSLPISTLEYVYARIDLAAVVPLEQRHRYAREALQTISRSGSEYWQAHGIEHLLPSCPDSLLPEVTELVQAIATPSERASALLALATYLPLHLQALAVQEARSLLDRVGSPSQRAALLCRLVTAFPEHADATVRAQALAAARAYPGHEIGADYLRLLAPLFPEQETQLLRESLDAALQLEEEYRVPPVLAIFTRLPESALAQAVQAAARFHYTWDRATILDALAPRLPSALLDEAVRIATTVDDCDEQALLLGSLAEALADQGAHRTALDIIAPILDTAAGSMTLAQIAQRLPPALLAQAQALAQALPKPSLRTAALLGLLPALPAADRRPIIVAGLDELHQLAAQQDPRVIWLLDQVAPDLDRAELLACLTLVQRLPADLVDHWDRERILPHVVVAGQREAAVALARECGTADAYLAVAPLLAAEEARAWLAEAYQRVREYLVYSAYAARDLARLSVAAEPAQRAALVAEALTAAKQLALDERASFMAGIAAEVAPPDRTPFVEEALAAVLGATAPARALAALAPMLTAVQAGQALALIDQLPVDQRPPALLAVLPALPATQQPALFAQIISAIIAEDTPLRDLRWDIGAVLGQLAPDVLYPLWTMLLRHAARQERHQLLSDLDALVPVLATLGGPTALAGAAHEVRAVNDLF